MLTASKGDYVIADSFISKHNKNISKLAFLACQITGTIELWKRSVKQFVTSHD
jgi:hypothetical protein